jgi:DNA-binding transcriptional ArsR family regulator
MAEGPDITRIGALLGDPARIRMLLALFGGEALTAGELAREGGVTPQTASSHLAKLVDGGLVTSRKQGRCVYFALAGYEVGELLEVLTGLAAGIGHRRTRPGPRDPAMRRARCCYDHLAGEMGVAMLDGLLARGVVEDRAGSLSLTASGARFVEDFGVDLPVLERHRRPLCKACLDWSQRRSHLGGALGRAMLKQIFAKGWARRLDGSRIVVFSAPGQLAFERALCAPPTASAPATRPYSPALA